MPRGEPLPQYVDQFQARLRTPLDVDMEVAWDPLAFLPVVVRGADGELLAGPRRVHLDPEGPEVVIPSVVLAGYLRLLGLDRSSCHIRMCPQHDSQFFHVDIAVRGEHVVAGCMDGLVDGPRRRLPGAMSGRRGRPGAMSGRRGL